MPQTYSTPAIALSSRAWRESDTLVEAYTLEFGKLSLLVKSGRKLTSKLTAHLEPITLLELMVIAGQGIPKAASAISRNCYPQIKTDVEKIMAAGKALHRFNRLVKESVRDDELFHLLSDFFALLNQAQAEGIWYEWFSKIFLVHVLKRLGLGTPKDERFVIPASLYDAVTVKLERKKCLAMNQWLETWLLPTIENAL